MQKIIVEIESEIVLIALSTFADPSPNNLQIE